MPSPERPLIYHLFGHMSQPESLVLSEDDFFQYLMTVDKQNRLPNQLTGALKEMSLLMVGFRADDWDFRVLLRSLFKSSGRLGTKDEMRSVAVQLVPEEGLLQPERARAHLQKYFQDLDVDTFWGAPGDFIGELARLRNA